jgi:hypothetical protein
MYSCFQSRTMAMSDKPSLSFGRSTRSAGEESSKSIIFVMGTSRPCAFLYLIRGCESCADLYYPTGPAHDSQPLIKYKEAHGREVPITKIMLLLLSSPADLVDLPNDNDGLSDITMVRD